MSHPSSTESAWAEGIGIFAGAALLTVGIFQFLEGVAAAAKDDVFVRTTNYVFEFDLTTWGWIHIILGVLVAIVGLALFTGAGWARVSAIIVAAISIVANFLWLPYYPGWSLLIIALDIVIIWAVSTWNPEREIRDANLSDTGTATR